MGFERSEETMGINCQGVWRDISDYIDDDLDPIQRAALGQHFAECRHCTALLEGTRNVIGLIATNAFWLRQMVFMSTYIRDSEKTTKTSRRTFLAWTLTAAAAVPLGLAGFFARRLVVPAQVHQLPATGVDDRPASDSAPISRGHDGHVFAGMG